MFEPIDYVCAPMPEQRSGILFSMQQDSALATSAVLERYPDLCEEPLLSALLRRAVLEGQRNAARAFLDRGANPDASFSGETLLMRVAWEGKAGDVELLLPRSDPDRTSEGLGETALMMAMCGRDRIMQTVRQLASASDLRLRDCFGQTPLIRAVAAQQYAFVTLLLERHGHDLAATDEAGRNALFHSLSAGNHLIFKVILSEASQQPPALFRQILDAQDRDGNTSLMRAAAYLLPDHLAVLAPVSNASLKNAKGETAFDLAWGAARQRLVHWVANFASQPEKIHACLETLAAGASEESIQRAARMRFELKNAPMLSARLDAVALRQAVDETAAGAGLGRAAPAAPSRRI